MPGRSSGFGAVARSYLERLPAEQGVRRDIDDNGDLLIRRMGKTEVERKKLLAALAAPSWFDPASERAAHVKLLRTIRLDPSDTFVFEKAAEPGEWAVSGAFVFWDRDPAALEGKARSAFRGGFLGVASLGWSTLVQIVEASDARSRGGGRYAGATTGREFRRADARRRARRGGRGSHLRRVALQPAAGHADRRASHVEDGEVREAFRTLRPRNGPKAGARLLVP